MATEITTATRGLPTAAAIAEAKQLCERGASSPTLTSRQTTALRLTVDRLSSPATEKWVRGRIFTLLSHYFQVDRREELEAAIADDWTGAIMVDPCPPAWAINAACVAWLGSKDSRRRPMPGDIRALAFEQMPWLINARLRLKIHDDPERWAFTEMSKRLALAAPDPEPTPEQRARFQAVVDEVVRTLESKSGQTRVRR